jgi:hypothetical protein
MRSYLDWKWRLFLWRVQNWCQRQLVKCHARDRARWARNYESAHGHRS